MEKVCTFEGVKEVVNVTSVSEVDLPEYNNMRKIFLRSKYEVNLALSRGIKVFQQTVKTDYCEHVVVYIEVPFEELLHVASIH